MKKTPSSALIYQPQASGLFKALKPDEQALELQACHMLSTFDSLYRSTVSFGADMRAPLSPLQQPLRRHPGQEQGNGHRKRKVSHFFGQQHGGPGSDSEDFLSMDEEYGELRFCGS